ncbi:MAG: antibiotic biosynthesis monooxygenase family protein [Phycisphaerae bacterium]
MVTIGMNYRVVERKEDIFEHAFNNVVRAIRTMDGHAQTDLFRDINDPQHYLIVSKWNSAEAFDEFINSDSFKNVTSWGKEQILSAHPCHEIYGEPETLDRKAELSTHQRPTRASCPVGVA